MSALDFSTVEGITFWLGLIVGVILGLVILGLGWKQKMARTAGIVVIVAGVLVILLGQIVGVSTPAAATGPQNAPPNASLTSYVATASLQTNVPSGAIVWNQNTETLTVYMVFNYTSNCWFISNVNQSSYTATSTGLVSGCGTAAAKSLWANYLIVPFHSARTDNFNQTFAFNYQISSIPTYTGLSSTAASAQSVCAPVAYTTATATQPGQWKAYWGSGQNSGQLGQQNAPTQSTNVAPDPTPITYYGSVTNLLHISLPGGNSTTAGSNCFGALQLYQALTVTASIANSTPGSINIAFVPVGEHA